MHLQNVFTCLTTRTVYLELNGIYQLIILCIDSRRGYPVEIFSDNGTNFTGGEREQRKTISELNQNKVYKELAAKRIKWNFSRPASP